VQVNQAIGEASLIQQLQLCTSSLGILQSKLPSASATYPSSDVIAAKINVAMLSLPVVLLQGLLASTGPDHALAEDRQPFEVHIDLKSMI
jgi:hypothetical protein